ncbi:hypothetical protein SAY86_023075 [Trapa natans]|uniref:Uncharacterized protein n=1 Tax=Trapa natans TaxID=22666 RepID=A0AAN7MA38_TRANT|nr:hypothetical protein SAY86_023075 [Trapa natans]
MDDGAFPNSATDKQSQIPKVAVIRAAAKRVNAENERLIDRINEVTSYCISLRMELRALRQDLKPRNRSPLDPNEEHINIQTVAPRKFMDLGLAPTDHPNTERRYSPISSMERSPDISEVASASKDGSMDLDGSNKGLGRVYEHELPHEDGITFNIKHSNHLYFDPIFDGHIGPNPTPKLKSLTPVSIEPTTTPSAQQHIPQLTASNVSGLHTSQDIKTVARSLGQQGVNYTLRVAAAAALTSDPNFAAAIFSIAISSLVGDDKNLPSCSSNDKLTTLSI